MKTSDDPARTRRRLIALIAAGIVLLVLTGIGVYGLLIADHRARQAAAAKPRP